MFIQDLFMFCLADLEIFFFVFFLLHTFCLRTCAYYSLRILLTDIWERFPGMVSGGRRNNYNDNNSGVLCSAHYVSTIMVFKALEQGGKFSDL